MPEAYYIMCEIFLYTLAGNFSDHAWRYNNIVWTRGIIIIGDNYN